MQNAEKISITMTSEMMRVIRESVEAGEYASTSEAMRDAFRAWQRERDAHRERLVAIKSRVTRSIADPQPDLSGDEVTHRLETLALRAGLVTS